MVIENVIFYWVGVVILLAFMGLLATFLLIRLWGKIIEWRVSYGIFWAGMGLFVEWRDKTPDWKKQLRKGKYKKRGSIFSDFYSFLRED